MSETFDEESLLKRLSRHEKRGWVVFSLACAERMLPNYRKFTREHTWGDIRALVDALDIGWAWLDSGEINQAKALESLVACQTQAPDTRDFDSIYVSPALDAASAAEAVVRLLMWPDPSIAVEIATLAVDTVDMFVQELEQMEPNSVGLEESIRTHPLMQAELLSQRLILEAIDRGVPTTEAVARWRRPGQSNIGFDV